MIVSASSFPCRSEAKICCSNTRVKNALNPASSVEAGHAAWRTNAAPRIVVRLGQVQHVHDAQEFREGVRQEIGVDRLPCSSAIWYQPLPMVS